MPITSIRELVNAGDRRGVANLLETDTDVFSKILLDDALLDFFNAKPQCNLEMSKDDFSKAITQFSPDMPILADLAIENAARFGHMHYVDELLAKANADILYAIKGAMSANKTEIVNKLIDYTSKTAAHSKVMAIATLYCVQRKGPLAKILEQVTERIEHTSLLEKINHKEGILDEILRYVFVFSNIELRERLVMQVVKKISNGNAEQQKEVVTRMCQSLVEDRDCATKAVNIMRRRSFRAPGATPVPLVVNQVDQMINFMDATNAQLKMLSTSPPKDWAGNTRLRRSLILAEELAGTIKAQFRKESNFDKDAYPPSPKMEKREKQEEPDECNFNRNKSMSVPNLSSALDSTKKMLTGLGFKMTNTKSAPIAVPGVRQANTLNEAHEEGEVELQEASPPPKAPSKSKHRLSFSPPPVSPENKNDKKNNLPFRSQGLSRNQQ